jgi:hypothetical protein
MNKRFRIKSVVVTEPYRLSVTFGDDVTMDIDVSTIMTENKFLSQLRDATLFRKARASEYGHEVVWNDEISIAGDNLRAEGVEQAGGISHERIWEWMHRNGLTLDSASEALGISRRMLAYYRNGEKPIPKHIWLACLGWEHNRGAYKGSMKQAA